MEDLKKQSSAPQKKPVFFNIGRVSVPGGGGIGGVLLLGGMLATAAFASAFIIGKTRRGGSGDNRDRSKNKKKEGDSEVNRKEECVEENNNSSETAKETQLKNDDQNLVLDEKAGIEINGDSPVVDACDSEASEQKLCSVTPTIQENSTIYNGGESHLSVPQKKVLLPLEVENTMVDETEIQSSREEATDEHGITEEGDGFEEAKAEEESRDDGAMAEGTFVAEQSRRDGKESILPSSGSFNSERENDNGDVEEIVNEYEVIKGVEEDKDEDIDEHLVQECVEIDEEEMIPQKVAEENAGKLSEGENEEKEYVDNPTPENGQVGLSDEDVQVLAVHLAEEMLINLEEIETQEEDAANDDTEASSCQHDDTDDMAAKNIENEVEDSSETIDTGMAETKDRETIVDETDGDEDLSKEDVQNTSMGSNLGEVWPAEAIHEPAVESQQLKLVDREIEGKIQEDARAKQGKDELHPHKIIADRTQIISGNCNLAKSFIERYVVDVATLKGYSRNSATRKVLVAAIPVMSSASCSWLLGLSFGELCLVVLLTFVLSKSIVVK